MSNNFKNYPKVGKKPCHQLLINLKIADAACRRNHKLMSDDKSFDQLTVAMTELYDFLRSRSISEIEHLF